MKRLALGFAHRARTYWWRLRKPQTLGVKVLVRNSGGEVLLVKPAYAATWQIPGGGVNKFEHPRDAGIRELYEETQIRLSPDKLALGEVFVSKHEGKSDCVIYYEGTSDSSSPKADGVEVVEARFFSPSALPPNTSSSVHQRLQGHSINGIW